MKKKDLRLRIAPRIMPGDQVIVVASFWIERLPKRGYCVGISNKGIAFAGSRAWALYESGEYETLPAILVPWDKLDYAAMGYEVQAA